MASRCTGMLCPIPYHYTAICAHCCYYVGVLWLVPSLVDFALMVDLLHHIEFDLHRRRLLARPRSVATDFFPLLVIVRSIRRHRFGKLDVGDL